jgi:hypothetical protein
MKYLLSLAFFALILTLCQSISAQPNQLQIPDIHQGHPRLLLLKGEEDAILTSIKNDSTLLMIHHVIIQESERILNLKPIERIQIGRRLLDKSREALRRIFYLSYAYRTTRDRRFLNRAEHEMLTISAFSDWNPSHFLDVAEMTMAVSIGYDWLYDQLSSSSKDSIKKAIITKGIEPSLEKKYNGWLTAEHNWNQVCNAGMAFGAIAIYEDQSVLANTIIKRAVESIKKPMQDYGPDGIYPEGYGYWDYGTTFNVLFLDAIERLYRTDFGLSAIPGFLESAGFMENMAGPTGLPFNYSDAGLGNGLHPAMFWIANKLGNSTLLWGEKKFLRKENAKNLVRDRALPAMLIWKGKIQLEAIRPPSQVNWIGHGKNPIAMMRTSWSDPNAIYIAAKGGSASINHAHMDAGSFVMDANGERWAMDFGSQNYESLESKGIKLWQRTQDSERWTVFRLNNFSHNTLIVDSQLHVMNGKASIIQQQMDEKNTQVTIDLGPVYANQLRSAKRSIAIIENQYVLTKDEIETLGHETKIRWNLLTPAKVEITGPHSAILRIGSKRLTLTASGAKNITMKTWSTEPPRPYDAPNPGTVIVGFETVIPADSKAVLEVTLVPGKQ